MTLDDAHALLKGRPVDLIALDDALNDLARLDPQQSRIVELRFFGVLSIEETAEEWVFSLRQSSDTGLQLESGYIGRSAGRRGHDTHAITLAAGSRGAPRSHANG